MNDGDGHLPRTALWRRIDREGMDACFFDHSGAGYLISGTALYLERGGTAKFDYKVHCDADWSSRSARVNGWIGSRKKTLALSRDPEGRWIIDGDMIPDADGLLDIDLGFTPATNTNAIKRLGLEVGEHVETTAIWLDTHDWCFKPLRQVYEKLSDTEFAYRSPAHNYSAKLVADAFGIIRDYPELWSAVSYLGHGKN